MLNKIYAIYILAYINGNLRLSLTKEKNLPKDDFFFLKNFNAVYVFFFSAF